MPGSTHPTLGELLRTHRIHAGLSQESLAAASGVSARTISDLERGQRTSAHLETVRMLADTLGMSGDERRLLFGSAVRARTAGASRSNAMSGTSRWIASIPTPATPLVGRSTELETLSAMLAGHTAKIVTLTGPGGAGKTRLVIEAARLLAPHYADGAAFVELASVPEAALVPDAIARALGMTPRANASAAQLADLLRPRELLLVLDNLEHVIDAAPFVAQLSSACPRLTILITSRVRLRVSTEREFSVPPLSLVGSTNADSPTGFSDAVLLFAERAHRADSTFELSDQNLAAVTEICRRLDGLPLAIELAASRLRVFSIATLLERLDRQLPLLTGGDRDRPSRQHSMRETIAWSYQLLDPAAKQLLQWMSVFPGGVSLDSAEALGRALGLHSHDALDMLSALVEYGLAVRSERPGSQSRVQLFETIREFGMEQLVESGQRSHALRFHATHLLEFASQDAPLPYEQIPATWTRRLSMEHPNLIAAFDYLCAPETAEECLRFAAAMGPYWHTRGPFSEWQPRLGRAFDLASPEPTILKTHVLCWLTLIAGVSPDVSAALQTADRCLEMAVQVGTTSDRATAMQMMAWVHECHGNLEIARELREQAIELWISVGNTYMHAICLVLNAGVANLKGELDRASCEAEQANVMFRELESIDWLASSWHFLALISVAQGRFDLGAEQYLESLRWWIQSESTIRWYRPLVGLADVAASIGAFQIAARLLGAADAMLVAGERDLTIFDRPGYARAETLSRAALGVEEFDSYRSAGRLSSPDDWLAESGDILAAARGIEMSSAP